jgi:glucokinase
MSIYRIGIDWGGTRIKFGAVTPDGDFLQQSVYDTPKGQEIDTVVEGILQTTAELIDKIGHKPQGIGLGLTGPVNPELGVVYLPGKVKGLENYPIVPKFAEKFDLPVTADNDGNVALFAERYCGKAQDVDWATVITIGTGVGSGVIVDGKILQDPNFLFGVQLGHIVMKSGDEPLCLTTARGTGEMYCSATALAVAVCHGLQRGIPSTLSERYFNDPHSIDFRTVIEDGVEQDDPLCLDELRRWTTNVGWLVVNAVHAYSSQRIILSGGATLGAKHFLPQVQKHVNQHTFRYPADREIPVVVSDIQEHAGVLGAAMMSLHRHP